MLWPQMLLIYGNEKNIFIHSYSELKYENVNTLNFILEMVILYAHKKKK